MLINFNTWGFFREACRVLKVDYKLNAETSSYLIEYEPSNDVNREELNTIAGGNYWIDIVLKYKNKTIDEKEAEQRLAQGIADAFKKKYKYVLNVPVKSNPDNKTPKYRLFHLTNHETGCITMADTMYKRINESVVRQSGGQMLLFGFSTEGDIVPDETIKRRIVNNLSSSQVHLNEFLCDYFVNCGIETNSSKLNQCLKELEKDGSITISRFPEKTKDGKPSIFMTEGKGKKVLLKKTI